MDSLSFGYADARTVRLQMRWTQKQASGDWTGHPDEKDPLKKTAEAALYQTQIDAERERTDGSEDVEEILRKAESGRKLTAKEWRILQERAPEVYQKLQTAEQDRKAYEKEIRRCRTKEDVQRLKMSRLGNSLAAVNAVRNNPHIPPEKKALLIRAENVHMEKINASTRRFVQRGEYAKLPTEAETRRAERDRREASEAAARGESTARPEETGETGGTDGPARPGEARDGAKPAVRTERGEKRAAAVDSDTPEVRKTRRARLKAAFSGTEQLPEQDFQRAWDA